MTDWLESVTVRAGPPVDDVEATLNQYGVTPSPAAGVPHRLLLERVAFSGTKRIFESATPFDFEWHLGPGLYCLASDRNLVGKTSVLETIRWALRGRSELRADVEGWIETVELDFRIDEIGYRVGFANGRGGPAGEITRRDTGAQLASFDGATAFEAVADAFFVDRLGLPTIPGWQVEQGGDGYQTLHSWPTLSELLRVTDDPYLLASVQYAGVNGKLLEIYAGVPWTSTYEAARVAIREFGRRNGVEQRRRNAVSSSQAARADELALERDNLAARLAGLPSDSGWVGHVAAMQQAAEAAETDLIARRRVLAAANEAVDAAMAAEIDDARALHEFEEVSLAERFFGALDPSMCPRCDTSIGSDRRRREATEHRCAVCGEGVATALVTEAEIAEARRRSDASKRASREALAAQRVSEEAYASAERASANARRALGALPGPTEVTELRRTLELDIARIEGRMAAIREASVTIAEDESVARTRNILDAARLEAEQRRRAGDQSVFAQLNVLVLELCREFGIVNAESVALDAAGRLNLRTGGATVALSALTPGERLRAKIAVVLGLLQLTRARGTGRHPGLVLIDSPAAHEVREADLGAILERLAALADSSGTQLIVTTREIDTARRVIAADHLRLPQADGTLW
jgi:hypothetical protein